MTRIVGPKGSRRRRRMAILLPLVILVVLGVPAFILADNYPQGGAGTGPQGAQFEVDGNLFSENAGKLDWALGAAGTGVITNVTRNASGTCSGGAADPGNFT